VHFYSLKTLLDRKHSFQKLTKFLLGNKVLETPVFCREIHVFFQLRCIGLFGTKCVFLPIKNPNRHAYSFQKLNQLSQVNKLLDAPVSNLNGFPSRDTRVS
jgi:hypothetical protein